jgi:hypothetical protein
MGPRDRSKEESAMTITMRTRDRSDYHRDYVQRQRARIATAVGNSKESANRDSTPVGMSWSIRNEHIEIDRHGRRSKCYPERCFGKDSREDPTLIRAMCEDIEP